MSEYTGVVQRIISKPFKNKTFYSFTLSGQDGFFGTGERKPPAEGTSVAFEADTNERGYLEVKPKTIQVRTDGVPETASVVKAAGKSAAEKGYWEGKQERDLRNDQQRELGASRNTAIALIDLMLKHEAVPMPKTANKREAYLWELLNAYTGRLMGKTNGSDTGSTNPSPVEEAKKEDVTTQDEGWA